MWTCSKIYGTSPTAIPTVVAAIPVYWLLSGAATTDDNKASLN